MVNVIVRGRDSDRWRHPVVTSQFLFVDGQVESQGIVMHVIAHKATDVRVSKQMALPFASRDFH